MARCSAMLLVERSGFGLNELLGPTLIAGNKVWRSSSGINHCTIKRKALRDPARQYRWRVSVELVTDLYIEAVVVRTFVRSISMDNERAQVCVPAGSNFKRNVNFILAFSDSGREPSYAIRARFKAHGEGA